MNWLKKNISTVIEMGLIIMTAILFVYALDYKVQDLEGDQESHIENYKNFRYNEVPDTYMRKDVMEQVLIRLDRIEKKIDRQNGN